jgi:predicted TIM-barrel fold metal-dependent hydrolase
MTLGISRRRFLQRGLVATCGFAQPKPASANQSDATQGAGDTIIDTHVYVGTWPFRQVASDDRAGIVAELRRNKVPQAWAGTFDGLLHKDVSSTNERLVEACRTVGGSLFVPFGTVNPTLPDWEEDVRRCHEVHRMPGIRLHPNFHGYTLDDPRFTRLLAEAHKRSLLVQIVCWLDSEQHSYVHGLMHVEISPLIAAARTFSELRFILANAIYTLKNKDTLIHELAALPNIAFDFGRMAEAAGVGHLVRNVKVDRVVLGSGAPLRPVEQAVAAVQKAPLQESDKAAIRAGNARRLIRDSLLRSE